MQELDFNCVDLIIEEDNIALSDSDKEVKQGVGKRDAQLKRWFITINNPFWNSEEREEVDIETTDLPINYDYYNLEYLKTFNNVDLFEFHFVKVTAEVEEKQFDKVLKEQVEIVDGTENKKLVEFTVEKIVKVNKEFVVERPFFKDYDCLKTYIEQLSIEGARWSVGQIEKGKEGTIHLQAGIVFDEKHGKRFYTMKKYFPTAYLAKMLASNYDVKVYCTKEETRLMPPFEFGTFVEMRKRTDYEEFASALRSGASNQELMNDFFHIVSRMGLRNLENLRNEYIRKEYGEKCRNIVVTFLYGSGGVGKTKSVYKEHGFKNVFKLLNYSHFCFHGYKYEKVLLLDEYAGQFSITKLNKMLDVYPYQCEIKGGDLTACYDKVYITSNLPFEELYKQVKIEDRKTYEAFERRIHFIYEVDDTGKFIPKKETVFEDIPEEEAELPGWTRIRSKTIKYDNYGLPHIVYDRHGQSEQLEFEVLEDKDLIFDEGESINGRKI